MSPQEESPLLKLDSLKTQRTEESLYQSKYLLTNQIAEDVVTFIGVMMGLLYEFYSMVEEAEMDRIREPLIEEVTTRTIQDDLHKILITFYQIETRELNF